MKISQKHLIAGYLPTIGIECHVQLKTKTKLFTAIANKTDLSQPANSAVGPLCLGLPGALPILNQKAVELAILAGLSLEAKIASQISFDRKHYFYPDLPLGYQISQHYQPIIQEGILKIPIAQDETFNVRIQRAHLEADAGKLTHVLKKSLIDLNRVGAPLLEIVSMPDMHSPLQAKQYAKELYLRMIYAQVCEGNLSAGNLRFDVNISLSKNLNELGTRTEIKNLNSFRFIEQALKYEIKRQANILQNGQKVKQETRGWDEIGKKTFSQRSKEDAQDYRYMPDPDIPPLEITSEKIAQVEQQLSVTPKQVRQLLETWQIPFGVREVLVDYPQIAEFLLQLPKELESNQVKLIINWLNGEILSLINKKEIIWSAVLKNQANLLVLAQLENDSKISSTTVKQWLPQILSQNIDPNVLLKETGQAQISDPQALRDLILQVFSQNEKAVNDAKIDPKATGFLIGQVIKLSQGKANAKLVSKLINELLKQ